MDFHLTSVISCTFSIHMYKLFFVKNLPDYSRQLCVFSGWFVVCCVAVILERGVYIILFVGSIAMWLLRGVLPTRHPDIRILVPDIKSGYN